MFGQAAPVQRPKLLQATIAVLIAAGLVGGAVVLPPVGQDQADAAQRSRKPKPGNGNQGRQIFRFDTFGDEQLWTDQLRLHEVIESSVSPEAALGVGLKVDAESLTPEIRAALAAGDVDLTDPQNTLLLIKQNAVVGIQGKVIETDVSGQSTRRGGG
jgi:hypothetical protein